MNHLNRCGIAALFAVVLAFPAVQAADVKHGQALYEKNCVSCHDASVFTRPDRRVKSYDALVTQVHRCDTAIGLKWFDEDVMSVVEFLNQNYYKFQR